MTITSTTLMWIGLTLIVALPVLFAAFPWAVIGAIVMVVGVILMLLGK